MLDSFRPDMVFFAPPPSAAKAMARDILKPYYAMLRNNSEPLPDLYAYPPNPNGEFYMDTIGQDINVVNVLPNMGAKLKDRDISKESYTIFNFPDRHNWSEEKLKELDEFFEPIGYTISVPASKINTMLGGFVSSHISEEIAMAISEGLKISGTVISFADIAGAMRYFFLDKHNRHFENSLECTPLDDERLNPILDKVIDCWLNGMLNHFISGGIDEKLGKEILIPQIDIFLQSAQLLSAEEIDYNNSCHATKGGILEKALTVFHAEIEEGIISTFANYPAENFDKEVYDFILEKACHVSKEVSEHGARFAD